MANETVTITIQSDDPSPVPVPGVVVQFFTTLGIFVTQGTTDSSGQVTALLAEATYNLLFYKQGVSILPKQPQQIVVIPSPGSNSFTVTGHVSTLPESPDPLRCRISGTLLGVDGMPVQDLRISFRPIPDLTVVGGNMVSVQSQIEEKSTSQGYFQFDLLRGLPYMAYLRGVDKFPLLGIEPASLLVIGPPLPSMSLVNLLFPLPVLVDFSQSSISIPLADGPDGSSTLGTIHYSDGSSSGTAPSSRTQPPPFAALDYVYSDPTLFTIILSNGSTQVTPLKVGTGTVTLTRKLPQAVFWPDPDGDGHVVAQIRRLAASLPSPPPERYAPVRLLWIKAIIRAAFDYALYRDHHDLKMRKFALDAERWLFEPSRLINSLENICQSLDIDIDLVRIFSRRVTREQVKKMEFLERAGNRDPARAFLAVLGAPLPETAEDDDGDE